MAYKTRDWRNSMRVTLDYNNMMEKFLGKQGFTDRELSSYNAKKSTHFHECSQQGYKDSNLEMTESESVALPFGDIPMS